MQTLRSSHDLSKLPTRPFLKPWYRLRFEEGRAFFQYGESVAIFSGRAVGTLLPDLLPLLDGTWDLEALRARFGESFEAVVNALAELQHRNLLTDGPALPGDLASSVIDAVHQVAADASHSVSPALTYDKLQRSKVALFGASGAVGLAGAALSAAGVGSVCIVDELEALCGADVAVVAPCSDDVESLQRWNETALLAARAWFPILPFDGEKRIVGPLFVPAQTACYHCFLARRRSAVAYREEFGALEATPARFPASGALDLMAAGVAVSILTHWLVDGDGSAPGYYYALEPRGGVALSRHRLYRVPRCAACGAQRRQGLPQPWSRA